jgi:hypothetical protein
MFVGHQYGSWLLLPFGAYNFQVVPRFLENWCSPDLDYLIQEEKMENEILNSALSSATTIISGIENGSLLTKLHKCNICFLTRACINLVKHFKSKWDFRLVSRYVYDWEIDAPACWVVILFYHTVMNISSYSVCQVPFETKDWAVS